MGGFLGGALGGNSGASGKQAMGGIAASDPVTSALGLPNPMNNALNSTMNNFGAQAANLQMPTTVGQADQAAGQVQNGLGQQQAFVNALGAQNGLGNQSSVFGQQQALANQLGQQAHGGGPNPALAQLNQTTGNNIASQASLMAGQRGAGANAGLMARQIANQGANTQQQAVGQAATMRANQQLGAEQALMGQQQNMAGLATNQVGQQAQGIQGYNQMAQGNQANLLNSIGQQNNANVAMQSNVNNANSATAQQNAATNGQMIGGLMNGVGGMASMLMAGGGEVPQQASAISGGFNNATMNGLGVPPSPPKQAQKFAQGGPVSFAGQFLTSQVNAPGMVSQDNSSPTAPQQGKNPFEMSQKTQKGLTSMMAKGGQINGEMYANKMEPVPGKAEKKGDSLKNDKVKALLSPGEVIIPRSVMQSKDPVSEAAKFVQGVMAKKGRRK